MTSARWLTFVDFVFWVGAVSTVLVVISVVLGLLGGGDLVAVKYLLFLFGVVLFGIGAIALQPNSPTENGDADGTGPATSRGPPGPADADDSDGALNAYIPDVPATDSPTEHRLEAWLHELPPLRDSALRLDQRIDRSLKLFVTGLVLLGVSAVMEFVFGIRI